MFSDVSDTLKDENEEPRINKLGLFSLRSS